MAKIIEIRRRIIDNLKYQGFKVNRQGIIICDRDQPKEHIRKLHDHSKKEKIKKENEFIKDNFATLSQFFADGKDVDINKFDPVVKQVEPNSLYSDLFRFATLLWSVPVSQGYGRRVRFVVLDKTNNKLIGLFALGDPVFNLGVRDHNIGWDHHMRADRLYNVMDLFVAGAVPPYSELLGGKLIAMLSTTREIRRLIWKKYRYKTTTIREESKLPHLVLITTSSALGRSSLYNRLTFMGRRLFVSIGTTSGWGHFHLSNGTFGLIREYLDEIGHPINKSNRFGQGPNWKIRAIRVCLESLGLPADLLRHGIEREVFLAPLTENYKEYLTGQQKKPKYYENSECDIVNFFKNRWFIPRAERSKKYLDTTAAETLGYITRVVEND